MQKCFDTLEVNASNVVVKASCMNQTSKQDVKISPSVTSKSEIETEEEECIECIGTIKDLCPDVKEIKKLERTLKPGTGTHTEQMNTLKELVKTYSFFYKIKPHYKNFCLEEMKVRAYIYYRVEDIKKWIMRTSGAIEKVVCNPTVSCSIPEPESEEKNLSNPIAITATQQVSGSTPAADYPTGEFETLKAKVITGIQEVETLLGTLQTAEQTDEQTAADKELTDKIESVVDSLGCIDDLADVPDAKGSDSVSPRSKNFPNCISGCSSRQNELMKNREDGFFLKLSKVDDFVEDVLSSLFDQTSCAEEEEGQVKGDSCSPGVFKRTDEDVFSEYMELKDKCMGLDTGKNPINALTRVPTDKDNSNKTEENMEEIFETIKSRLKAWYEKTPMKP